MESPPTGATPDDLSHPHATIDINSRPEPATPSPDHAARKIEVSASLYGKGRPEWERLKTELRQGDVLVMWEASRAARDLEEFVALRNQCAELSVPLCYGGKVVDLTLGDDRFVAGLDALIAERESEQTRVRVLRGKRAGALEGRPAGRVPWGYRKVAPGVWEPDPVEAARIKIAVERILATAGGELRDGQPLRPEELRDR